MLNVPNILTLARLALLPVLIWLLFLPYEWAAWCGLGLYALGAVTDWFDGWYARRFNQITAFGTFLDPIADKIYVASLLLVLVATDRIADLWVIAVILIFVREFTISGLREYLGPKNVQMPVSKLAKWKTALQMIATGVLIIAPFIPYGMETGLALLILATLLTLETARSYLIAGLSYMKD